MLFILTPYYLQAIWKKNSREEKMDERLSTHFVFKMRQVILSHTFVKLFTLSF